MSTINDETHELFRDSFRSFVNDRMLPHYEQWEADGIMDRGIYAEAGKHGFVGMAIPEQYGGGGTKDFRFNAIISEELATAGIGGAGLGIGLHNDITTPYFIEYCNDEQAQRWLPGIASGELITAIAMTEPGTGSDLASIATSAVRDGDEFVINGQKVWTSYADKSDWIFALVRSNPEGSKHDGITFLLIDFDHGGVTTKPIQLISGVSPFCETFIDDVSVPKEIDGISTVVGEVNRGWDVAKYLLTHERTMISAMGTTLGTARPLGAVLSDDLGGQMDTSLRAAAMKSEIDSLATALTLERYKDMAESGQGVGDASAMLKYVGTELNKQRHELMMSAGGSDALEWDGDLGTRPADWLRTKANSIEGGTSEVMLGIVSRRVLGLPG